MAAPCYIDGHANYALLITQETLDERERRRLSKSPRVKHDDVLKPPPRRTRFIPDDDAFIAGPVRLFSRASRRHGEISKRKRSDAENNELCEVVPGDSSLFVAQFGALSSK